MTPWIHEIESGENQYVAQGIEHQDDALVCITHLRSVPCRKKENKILNVQSGAIWADVQQFLDKEGLAVKAMQSINIFTVGGTLSVNAHGIAHDPGPIAPTVKSMRVMLSNGEIKTASPTQNSELFKSVLGGYGLFGVILDVNLEVVENEMYEWTRDFMDYKDFPEYYRKNIENNDNIGLLYGRLSMSPTSYLTETIVHKYKKTKFWIGE